MKSKEVTAEYLANLLDASQDPDIRRAIAMLRMLRQQQAEIDALKCPLLKHDRLAWDDLDKVLQK